MPARLSSLLVRDGLVTVKRMERVFQRQVIYGGALDSILLEMNLISEERLTQYLALACGLPPASRDEAGDLDPAAVARLPRELAEQYRVVPLALDADALRLLVCDPVDLSTLEDLADSLDLALRPLIVPEYRWHVAMARAYGTQAPARFSTLARQVEVSPVTAPVGRARSVIVAEVAPAEPAAAPDPGPAEPSDGAADDVVEVADARPPPLEAEPRSSGADEEISSPVPVAVLEDPSALVDASSSMSSSSSAAIKRTRTRELSTPALTAELDRAEQVRREAERRYGTLTEPMDVPPIALDEVMAPIGGDQARSRQTLPGVLAPARPRAASQPVVSAGAGPDLTDPRRALSPAEARAAMMVATRRDDIFELLLRGMRTVVRWAGLLTVQGGAAIGRVAVADAGVDTRDIAAVLLPLDSPSPFLTAVTTRRPYVGPLHSGDAGIDRMLRRMGGAVPPAGLVVPVVLRDRVVALVVAHRVDRGLSQSEVGEVVPLVEAAVDALAALIVRNKATGYRAATEPPVVETVHDVATKPVGRPSTSGWAAPAPEAIAAPVVSVVGPGPTAAAFERPLDQLLDAIERADDAEAQDAMTEAVERTEEVLPHLAARFPGKLRVDRYAVSGRPLRAAQYGGLLELVTRIGPPAADLLITKLSDPGRDVRFYAAVCAGELRPRTALQALVERVFDPDYGIRDLALEALAGYPVRDLEVGLLRARHAVHSEDGDRVAAAATAIATLADLSSIPDLIDVLAAGDRRADHVRRALVALTRQDFGTSERKWRRWWDDNRSRHRLEWLIDALGHKEATLRQGAGDELRRLTGEYFGYHHDLPRRERDAAIERWQRWWQDAGRRRFVRDEDERLRPTAQTPAPRPR